MSIQRSVLSFFDKLQRFCKTVHGLYKESPMIFSVVLAVIALLILIGYLFNKCFSAFLGSRGAIVLDLVLVWLLVRLIVRIMVFPGSMTLVQRNTEATYRVEMARQYSNHLKQLVVFMRYVAKHSVIGVPRGLTPDGILRGCSVIDCITKSFRMQQQDHVKLSSEQAKMFALASGIMHWVNEVKIQNRREGDALAVPDLSSSEVRPLMEWLRALHSGGGSSRMFSHQPTLLGVELVDAGNDALRHIDHIDELIEMLTALRSPIESWWQNTLRFLRVPTVGSLHQLRTELQMRYSSTQCWVPSRRGTLDGMFIPCEPDASGGGAGETAEAEGEDIPLTNLGGDAATFSGPTLVWCNPNAGYYETMVYQANILNFYLDRGVNIFLFNYSGFGRSRGLPTCARVAEDADSVVEFLRSKGLTQIGVHGRSIGGIAACHLAKRHPDIVKFIVTDRTFSTLGSTAKYTYGAWAEKGLAFGAMWADNMPNFLAATCHKVMVCDPKDGIIPDLASLRSAMALQAISRMAPEERLDIDDETLLKLSEAWRFFTALFTICEEQDDDAVRPAREPTITSQTSASTSDVRLKVGDSSGEPVPVVKKGAPAGTAERIGEQWLHDHASILRSALGHYIDQVRLTLDVVIEHLDAGGLSLHDVLGAPPDDACFALNGWLANLQVWGAIGDPREAADSARGLSMASSCQDGISDFEIECFLRKSDVAYNSQREVYKMRLQELEQTLSPSTLTNYHRILARTQVLHVRREFRRRLASLQQSFRISAVGDVPQSPETEQLRAAVLEHLGQVEAFVVTLGRFFKSVDLMLPYNKDGQNPNTPAADAAPLSDSSDEKADGLAGRHGEALIPRPIIDHSICGHVVHTDCGHNGVLDDTEFRLIGVHMRVARFGRVNGAAS